MASNGVAGEEDAVEAMETEMSPEPNADDTTPSPQPDSPVKPGSGAEGLVETHQDTAGEKQEEEEEDDPCCSERLLQFMIRNFSQLNDQVLSDPVFIRNLPWRLLVMPREVNSQTEGKIRGLGVFVQCNPKSPESTSWNISAHATITLVHQTNTQNSFSRDIYHCFCARENDWGYSNFMALKDMEEKGFIKDDTIVLQAHVKADAPHGINWDSRKHTGYVGLKNQGATCYMNSLLQTLYCTNKLRKAVYQMPTENDDAVKSVPLALQRLFYELQHSDKPVGTKKLTKSFGWDTMDIFMQHDVQELSRVLLDNIESKMKGTVVEGTIARLFEGKMESYIRCTHVEYESTRVETFFDIQLNIKGKKNVYESFKDYVAVETLKEENKYDAGDLGMQEAKKGVIFVSFPPVLHLHLMRFQYDPVTDTNVKINDRYEFPEKLHLEEFLKEPEATPADYTLHAVLVHSGDNYGGHYVAYLNPRGEGKILWSFLLAMLKKEMVWLKFDDDVVSTCSRKDAIESNFGGNDDSIAIRNVTNAYMLVYIRDSCLADVLQEVTDTDISKTLVKRIADEKHLEYLRRKERSEAHLYLTVEVYLEDDFQAHQGFDLVDFEDVKPRSFKVLKTSSYAELHQGLAAALGYPKNQIRVWPFEKRTNHTTRPSYLDKPDDPTKTVFQHAEMWSPWRLYVETLPPDSDLEFLPPYDYNSQVLLFFKYYNPATRLMKYISHVVESLSRRLCDVYPFLRERAGLPPNTPLLLFEEVKPNLVEHMDPKVVLSQVEELRDGDIFCFQRDDVPLDRFPVPTVLDYFRDLYNRLDVTFYNKNIPGDPGFILTLNQRMNYSQMARSVALHLSTDPALLQFFRPQLNHRHYSDQPIRCSNEGCVRDFVGLRHRTDAPPLLFYQKLSIPIDQFENKKWFKCIFVSMRLREEKDLTLYVDKNGTVEDLLQEAANEITFSEGSTKHLRLLEVMTHRIVDVHATDKPVTDLYQQKLYRIEEVRSEELVLNENEALIPVAHFQKAAHNVFGVPFLLKIRDGEKLSSVTNRIKNILEVPEKEFDKWKFAIVQTIQPFHYLSEENDDPLHLSHFLIKPSKGIHFPRMGMPWLGLDHINKSPKRTRYTMEKAIKIHN